MRSPALKAAQKRYDDKRKSRRLSSIYFTEDNIKDAIKNYNNELDEKIAEIRAQYH